MNPLKTEIVKALNNPNLQIALDNSAHTRIAAHHAALTALPDYPGVRQVAHQARARVIENLDQFLDQFEDKLRENGWVVHRAKDSAEACRITVQIAQSKNARLVAKSKTMVSEEISLNPALEAAGIKVVETDLGEYIVQLRGEHPSHITTPAIHLRKEEVAQTFHELLGEPANATVPEMTLAARRRLREVFLKADIGITGVNFGVAETGTICIVTNEGNGRMVTTLPPVHIALMGIERLVAAQTDLALMLKLLSKASTGQKITVYTQFINKPRAAGEADGAPERHIILIDNGRSRMKGSPLQDALLCIRCGACLNVCPVFRELGGHAYVGTTGGFTPYAGPIGSIISPAFYGQAEFGNLARASSLCGACKEACPVDIDLPKMLLRVRAGGLEPQVPNLAPRPVKSGLGIFTWFAKSPTRFSLAQRMAGWFSQLLFPRRRWISPPAFTGWGLNRQLPRPAATPFHARFKSLDQHVQVPPARGERRGESTNPAKPTPNSQDLVEKFALEWEILGGEFRRSPGAAIGDTVISILRQHNVSRIQVWSSETLPHGLVDQLHRAGFETTTDADPSAEAGLTGAHGAIADTGSLIMASGEGTPHTASLLPPLHLAILAPGTIQPDLDTAVRQMNIFRDSPCLSLISGPSRTGDIEMTLTIGVHGPGTVYAICLDD